MISYIPEDNIAVCMTRKEAEFLREVLSKASNGQLISLHKKVVKALDLAAPCECAAKELN